MSDQNDIRPALTDAPPWEIFRDEIPERCARLRKAMAEGGLDLIVFTDKANITYFSGYYSLSWAYHARPVFLVVDQNDVVIVTAPTDARNLEAQSIGARIVHYKGFLSEGVVTVLDVVRSANPATTGIDYGYDMFGRGSLALVSGLSEICGKMPLEAADVIWSVRMVKSPREALAKHQALCLVDQCFDETCSMLRAGMTERNVYAQLQSSFFLAGLESAAPIAVATGRAPLIYNRPPTNRALIKGDYLWTDFRATIAGYPADRNRVARVGDPKPWEVDLYARVHSVARNVALDIRAGETMSDIYERYQRAWSDAGLKNGYDLVARIGHGGGLGVTEPPSISPKDNMVVQEGMILHVEPKLEHRGAVFQFEEVVYVTSAGVDCLSQASPDAVPVINPYCVSATESEFHA